MLFAGRQPGNCFRDLAYHHCRFRAFLLRRLPPLGVGLGSRVGHARGDGTTGLRANKLFVLLKNPINNLHFFLAV